MSDIVEFLTARLDEDEAAARAAEHSPPMQLIMGRRNGVNSMRDHIARHDPARVLAEVEAKQRIVEEHGDPAYSAGLFATEDEVRSVTTLRLLAAIYADHPDYQEEWKP